MKIIHRTGSLLRIVLKRMTTQPWLVVAKTLGLFVGMVMMLAIPLYTDAVNFRVFSRTTLDAPDRPSFPPFSILSNYIGVFNGPLNYEEIEEIDAYYWEGAYTDYIGLPVRLQVKNMRTNNFQVFPTGESEFDSKFEIMYAALNYISDFEKHVTVIDGSFENWDGLVDRRLPVMIHQATANETGIKVGEQFTLVSNWRDEDNQRQQAQIPVIVTATYRQINENDYFWYFGTTNTLKERFIISQENYAGALAKALPNEVHAVSWFHSFDSSNISFDQTGKIRDRIEGAGLNAMQILPGTATAVSPLKSLTDFAEQSRTLSIYLFIICVPIIILILFFIGMVSKIEVDSRLNEIAILRSRGATRIQIVLIEAFQAFVLGVIAAGLAIPVSLLVTQLIGRTRSFLDFSLTGESLRVIINNPMLYTAGIMVLIAMIAQIIPSLSASKHTVQSYKREQARLIRKTWWQRLYLDFLLLALVLVGMVMVQDLERIGFYDFVGDNSIAYSLVYLLPIFLSVAVSMLFLRFMPMVLGLLSWIMGKTRNVNFLMAVRALHRMPNAYQMPLMLLIITVNIAVFTTTLASAVDQYLTDQFYYKIGSELRFIDFGEDPYMGVEITGNVESGTNPFQSGIILPGQDEPSQSASANMPEESWAFLPVEYYSQLPGALAASRLGTYSMRPGFTNATYGVFFGIDRLGFSQAAFWRKDFSDRPLSEMMNQLAAYPNGVLISRTLADRYGLTIGSLIPVNIYIEGDSINTEMIVVGIVNYFPTWYPDKDGDLMVGNLDYLFAIGSGPYPYSVILASQPGADSLEIATAISQRSNISWRDGGRASYIIQSYQKEPNRQGLFGMLTLSFLITALLSFLGFLLYAVFSLRRRLIELGVLRAIGLSSKQMGATLAWEFLSLIFGGALVGTFIGVFNSRFFVPFMQIGTDTFSQTPPYYITIAWGRIYQIYGLLAVLFIILVFALVAFLRRIKIFEAIKLGETV
ncbi:MAG TPA: ABC transporter permease [Chloroflexi bacterium]|nr:ABC transporter permease [Chloroflexota bacterium]